MTELYRELMRRGELIKQRESLERFQKEELQKLGKDRENFRKQYRELQKEKDALYELYASGQMDAACYRHKADESALQMQELSCKMEKAERQYSRIEEEHQRPKPDMKQIIRLARMEELTQEAVDIFIKKLLSIGIDGWR